MSAQIKTILDFDADTPNWRPPVPGEPGDSDRDGPEYDYFGYNTGVLLPGEQSDFFKKLEKKVSDGHFNDYSRQKAIQSQNNKTNDYVYTLSHNKAIGSISRTAEKQLFQGSSFNRKKKLSPEQVAISESAKTESEKLFESKLREKITGLRRVKKLYQNEPLDGRGMSRRTREKLREKILAFYKAANGRANRKGYRANTVEFHLITLTFIGRVTDRHGTAILNKFLTQLHEKYGNFSFTWVAEKQGNGNIHFHMVCDRRFKLSYINSLWTVQQIRAGVRNYEKEYEVISGNGDNLAGEGCDIESLHHAKQWRTVQKYFNPVDIEKVKTIDGVSCYLTNYVTKNESKIYGRAWHCSRSVSRIFTKKIISRKVFDITGNSEKNRITSRKGKEYINKTFFGPYCIINSIYNKAYYNRYLSDMQLINEYILQVERTEKIDADLIRQYNIVDNVEFRKKFLSEKLSKKFILN